MSRLICCLLSPLDSHHSRVRLPCRRVCEVKLLGNHKFELNAKKFKVTDGLKTGPAVDLFSMSIAIDVR